MERIRSLDIFRGMTICLMIIVNTPGDWGSTFGPLLHASWHGFTPTDLVFPSFMFAVGNALAFVMGKWQSKPFGEFARKVLRRFFILFLLGYTMYWIPFVRWTDLGGLEFIPFQDTRIPGVLQRIALGYMIGAFLVYFFKPRQLWFISGGILLAYWGIMYAFGDYSLEGNAVRKLDQFLLGPSHLYAGDGIPFDPEGLLSTLPSIVNVIAGFLLGNFLTSGKIDYEKLAKVLMAGALAIFVALAWDMLFPINKKLWTSSYVLLTVGLDLVILALILYTTDFLTPSWNYNFFQVFGKNSLFIYLLSEYVAILALFIRVDKQTSLYAYIYQNVFQWMGPFIGSFAFALAFMMLCWAVAYLLDQKKIYVKV
ncbi:MAG: DUF5009 domain-containing protein [Bacteroidia bacterium]|nr:DUF5009 domain-containing protein [Bacteroidia bacterium]